MDDAMGIITGLGSSFSVASFDSTFSSIFLI